MRYVAETTKELDALLATAQNEPVFIEQGQREIAVLVSVREYERLSGTANRDFQTFCDSVSDKAAANGLSESKFNDLLKVDTSFTSC